MDSSAGLQIWNNEAFDNGDASDLTEDRQSWGSLLSTFQNPKVSFNSESEKENNNGENKISSISSSVNSSTFTPFKQIDPNDKNWGKKEISRVKGGGLCAKGNRETLDLKSESNREEIRDENRIDKEIEEIESEILKLSLRLRALKVEKSEKSAELMEQKPIEEIPSKPRIQRRSSIVPAEIVSGRRRGMSMGPCEISGSSKSKQEMITPIQQNRRKSCYWKLQEIDEDKVVLPRQAVTTIASRKTVKKENAFINSVQPKKLFNETDKKPLRAGRVVASRYNQNITKRSLPENRDEAKGFDKLSLSVGKSRVKKRWEIPSEVVVHGSVEAKKSCPKSTVTVPDWLPRVRIDRYTRESPRDSGPAKRVAELIGKKSFFTSEEEEPSLCQALTYADE